MRNNWARAWIAAAGLLVAASAFARSQTSKLLAVEEPVMDWLLDGTDTSIWDNAAIFSASWLLILGTIILAVVGFTLDIRVGLAVVVTTIFAFVLTNVVSNVVDRTAPLTDAPSGTFPSNEVVQAGVFWGLVVMMIWWVGAPKLVWQIILEFAVVILLVISIRLVVAGEIWPSDAVGSAIVVALTLITAAIVLESNPPTMPSRLRNDHEAAPTPVSGSTAQ